MRDLAIQFIISSRTNMQTAPESTAKSILASKTVWLAVIQAISGIAVAVLTQQGMLGGVLVVKSVVDIILRLITTDPIA